VLDELLEEEAIGDELLDDEPFDDELLLDVPGVELLLDELKPFDDELLLESGLSDELLLVELELLDDIRNILDTRQLVTL